MPGPMQFPGSFDASVNTAEYSISCGLDLPIRLPNPLAVVDYNWDGPLDRDDYLDAFEDFARAVAALADANTSSPVTISRTYSGSAGESTPTSITYP